MSTSAVQVNSAPSWKEEVNRRLAEHKGRKPGSPSQTQGQSSSSSSASRRAQEAAARVAARYAKAPSYSEVLAAEARAALRAAEAASQAAMEAHAAVQSVLAGIEAAAKIEPPPMPQLVEAPPPAQIIDPVLEAPAYEEPYSDIEPYLSAPPAEELVEPVLSIEPVEPLSIRWDRELPPRTIEPADLHEIRGRDPFQEQWWKLANDELLSSGVEAIEEVEPAQPIQGNVIEFPRELVAARKARPRIAETAAAEDESGVQLSIFEIDPGALPAAPAIESTVAPAPAEEAWTAPRWSGIELDAQPFDEAEELLAEPLRAQPAAELEPATAGWRLLSICMDAALVFSAVFGAGIVALQKTAALPSLRTAEIAAAAAVVLFAGIYQVLFFTLGLSTPGMRYAHLQLCTLEGNLPTRAQRSARLLAMLLSVLPAALGLAWAIFDENHLAWHDRLSGTYLRRG